jgi:hypothetical protein
MADYIHIGYPKTGTTTLQNSFFARQKGVVNLGQPDAFVDREKRDLIRAIAKSVDWNSEKAEHLRRCYEELEKDETVKYVLSDESLAKTSQTAVPSRFEVADRLHSLFPDAKIIIGVREQKSMLKSTYIHRLKSNNDKASSAGFNRWLETQINEPDDGSNLPALKYDEIVAYYQNLFSRETVLILIFEELQKNPSVYLSKLRAFLDLPDSPDNGLMLGRQNRSVSNVGLMACRLFAQNNIVRRILMTLPMHIRKNAKDFLNRLGSPCKVELEPGHAQYLDKYYAKPNARLSDLQEQDLGAFGYSLSPLLSGKR